MVVSLVWIRLVRPMTDVKTRFAPSPTGDLHIGGIRTVVQDTAGLRAEGDEVELEGHRRAQGALAVADLALVLWPVDGAEAPPVVPFGVPTIRLRSKADVDPGLIADDGSRDRYPRSRQILHSQVRWE